MICFGYGRAGTTPRPAGQQDREQTPEPPTGDLVARDHRGEELARVTEGSNKEGDEAHAGLARKAHQTLAAWYN